MLEFAQHNGVAEMQIGSGGINAELDAQWFARGAGTFELGAQLLFANDFSGAFAQRSELLIYGTKFVRCGHGWSGRRFNLAWRARRGALPNFLRRWAARAGLPRGICRRAPGGRLRDKSGA